MRKIVICIMILCMLTSCGNRIELEYWTPTEPVNGYYIIAGKGSIKLGDKFEDEEGLYIKTVIDEKKNIVNYRQPLGMYDFTTDNGSIVEITTASGDCLLNSKIFVGMTKQELVGSIENCLIVEEKGTTILLDVSNSVSVEAKFNSNSGKSEILRLSCIRGKE